MTDFSIAPLQNYDVFLPWSVVFLIPLLQGTRWLLKLSQDHRISYYMCVCTILHVRPIDWTLPLYAFPFHVMCSLHSCWLVDHNLKSFLKFTANMIIVLFFFLKWNTSKQLMLILRVTLQWRYFWRGCIHWLNQYSFFFG